MSGSKHPKTKALDNPFPDDLERNPGIGQSKGLFSTGADPEDILGSNAAEGDVENEANTAGGVSRREGRHNK